MWPLPASLGLVTPGAGSVYTANAVNYSAYGPALRRNGNFDGLFDAPTGILSFWQNREGNAPLGPSFLQTDGVSDLTCLMTSSGVDADGFQFLLAGSTSGTLHFQTNTALASMGWIHVLASWDTNHPGGGGRKKFLYTNDTSNINVTLDGGSAFACRYSLVTDWEILVQAGADVCLAEIYFAPGQYLDFSVTANRRKFISASGMPVSLGPTGALPTGMPPVYYNRSNAANITVNSGTGGDMASTGTFTTCASHP